MDEEIREYTIYHVVGRKVGCTANFENRKIQYPKGTVFEVLEIVKCTAQVAGDLEWHWADKFGYDRGWHYADSNWNVKLTPEHRTKAAIKGGASPSNGFNNGAAGRVGGRIGVASQLSNGVHASQTGKSGFQTMTFEKHREVGRLGATAQLANGTHISQTGGLKVIAGIGGKIGGKVQSQIEYVCPGCGRVGKGNRWKGHVNSLKCREV